MSQYERIDISEGIIRNYTNKRSAKELCFVIIGISKILVINLKQMFIINVMM